MDVLVDDGLVYLDHRIGLRLENRDVSDALSLTTGICCSYHVFTDILVTDCQVGQK